MNRFKTFLKNLTPPLITDWYHQKQKQYGFFGNYQNWTEALKNSTGYDAEAILAKVRAARHQVKAGQAAYERDGVTFDKIDYSWPVLAGLLWIAGQNQNRLNLIDFGGSLGTSYFQHLPFLGHLKEIHWNVVEQENFVNCGKTDFQNEQLKFYPTINDCLIENPADTFVCLTALQYLAKPYQLLEEIVKLKFNYLIFDRITFINNGPARLTVQKVPPRIYDASYPAWFLDLQEFLDFFSDQYQLVADFNSPNKHTAKGGFLDLGDAIALEKGFIFKRKDL